MADRFKDDPIRSQRSLAKWRNRRYRLLLNDEEEATTDPNFSNVVLLAGLDGDYTDRSNSAHTLTNANGSFDTGDTNVNTTDSWLNDSSSDKIDAADHDDWDFAEEDFTIELFYKPSSQANNHHIISHYSTTGGQFGGWRLYNSFGNYKFGFYDDSYSLKLTGTLFTLTNDEWAHIALCRNGEDFRAFKDGALTFTNGTPWTYGLGPPRDTTVMRIGGGSQSAVFGAPGNYEQVRITKGFARYTEAFTAPTEPFPTS